MDNSDDQSLGRERMMKRLIGSEVPWPEDVVEYLFTLLNYHTRRMYLLRLETWLPLLEVPNPWDVERMELIRLRNEILEEGGSKEIQRQTFAALMGFFQFLREEFPFNHLDDSTIERIFGSEVTWRRRKDECFSKLSSPEPEEEWLCPKLFRQRTWIFVCSSKRFPRGAKLARSLRHLYVRKNNASVFDTDILPMDL